LFNTADGRVKTEKKKKRAWRPPSGRGHPNAFSVFKGSTNKEGNCTREGPPTSRRPSSPLYLGGEKKTED